MKKLSLMRYYTMNSWNESTAPAFNLKVYNVIPPDLQNKVFELMDCEDFYDEINDLIHDFDTENEYKWQAGFNGRSGGYLVLYAGGIKDKRPFSYPGRNINNEDVPEKVLNAFTQLAEDIVSCTIESAKNSSVIEETYTVTKTRKVMNQ